MTGQRTRWVLSIAIALGLIGAGVVLVYSSAGDSTAATSAPVTSHSIAPAMTGGTGGSYVQNPSPVPFPLSPYSKEVPAQSSSVGPGTGNAPPPAAFCGNLGGCNYNVCQTTGSPGYGTFWTPVIIVNAPYDGSATGSSSVSVAGSFLFSFDQSTSIQSTTTSATTNTISASSGQTEGYFQSIGWEMWHVVNVVYHAGFFSYYYPDPCQASYVPQVNFFTTQFQAYTLASGDETTTGVLNAVTFTNTVSGASETTLSGMNSLDYVALNDQSFGDCGGNSFQKTVTDSTSLTESIGITISVGIGPVSVEGGFSFSSSTTSTAAYTYNFNGNAGTWLFDSLNGQSGGLIAFDFYACNSSLATGCFIPASGGCNVDVSYAPGQTMQMSITVPTSSAPTSVQAVINNGAASVHPWSTSSTGWTYTIDFGGAPNSPGTYVVYAIVAFSNGATSWTNSCQVIII